ncbi:MAG: aminopeptidase [Candidatus Kapabacteria bacterium]|nr:aminopeptidase [Candidatus Kapabacteria bacterium]
MKVFIAVDMEGATGVVHHDQLMPEGRGYAVAQRYLTGDVNAVIAGILDADHEAEIIVGEGHAIMRNILLDELHPQAQVVVGPARPANKPLCQMEGIDGSVDLCMCVGFHSKAGTPGGLLAHTFVGSVVCNWMMNDKAVGEVEVDAAIAGAFGVPLGLVVGNHELEHEIRAWHPEVEFVSTKQTLGPSAAICRPPSWTRVALRHAARTTMERAKDGAFKPYHIGPTVTMTIETYRREMTDRAVSEHGVVRVDDRRFQCSGPTAADAFRLAWRAIARALDEPASFLQ